MRRRGAFLFPLLVLFAGASLIREAAVGWLVPGEQAWEAQLARRMTYLGDKGPQTTLVVIDDETLTKHVWPWSAEDFAVFLNAALPSSPGGKPFEPAVVGIEPVLSFEKGVLAGSNRNALHERALHDGILRAPKLALGGRLGWSKEIDSVQPLQPMPVLHKVQGDISRLAAFTAVDGWAEEALRLSTQPGWMNVPAPGPRGLCALVVRYRGQPVPTMPLQLAMMWAKVTPDEVEVTLGESISIGPDIRVPIDEAGRMRVNFGAAPARVSYDDLQVSRYQMDQGNPPLHAASVFHQKVLFLARTDAASRTLDVPVGGKISPGELAVFALMTIQAKAYPVRIGGWFDWSLVGLATVISFWLPRWRTRWMALTVVMCEVAYLGAALWLFRTQLLALPAVMPLGLMLWLLLLRVFAKPMQKVIAF